MKKTMFMFAAALMMVACSNEEVAVNDDVQYVSELKLNFGSGDSRVAATHNPASGLKFAWEDEEEIQVYENANADAITFYYVYDESTQSFKPENESYKMVAGKEYFAVKGVRQTNLALSVEDGKTIVKMNVERTGKGLPHIPMITDVFTADAGGAIATMHHLVGVVEIPVKKADSFDETVTGFSLYASGGKLGREFTATPGDGYVKSTAEGYDTAKSEEKTYTLSTTDATSVFIPVLPGTYSGVYLNYYTDSSSGSKSVGDITVVRGKITKLNEVYFE